jgi:hypothetical protein
LLRTIARGSTGDEYQAIDSAGRHLRSPLLFSDGAGLPVAALGLNADMTVFEMTTAGWSRCCIGRPSHCAARRGRRDLPRAMMQEIIDDAVRRFMKPSALMDREEKMYAV